MASVVLIALLATACSTRPQAYGVYTHDTRELVRLDYDHNADGVIDVRTYMRAGKPVRLEGDGDGDGRVDRWEYYDAQGELLRIGGSTRRDGCEDTWARTVDGETHVDVSTRRDGTVDRREVYRGQVLLRTESDTNHDGLTDAWEEFEGGTLARLSLDEAKRTGRPSRRIVYAGGGVVRLEADPDGDGRFVEVPFPAGTGTKEASHASR